MLLLEVSDKELYDEEKEMFFEIKGCTLKLEHSLISMSLWESEWNVPFLTEKNLKGKKLVDYIKFMSIDKNVKDAIFETLSAAELLKISEYIDAPMTATTFREYGGRINREIITSELIYYWMIEYGIPFECQKWHLNRLLTLIKVCNIKNSPQKKMKKNEILEMNRSLNEQRRRKHNTKG